MEGWLTTPFTDIQRLTWKEEKILVREKEGGRYICSPVSYIEWNVLKNNKKKTWPFLSLIPPIDYENSIAGLRLEFISEEIDGKISLSSLLSLAFCLREKPMDEMPTISPKLVGGIVFIYFSTQRSLEPKTTCRKTKKVIKKAINIDLRLDDIFEAEEQYYEISGLSSMEMYDIIVTQENTKTTEQLDSHPSRFGE